MAVVLGPALGFATWSRVTGRAPRAADALLGVTVAAGGWFLWAVGQPRPVAPWAVGVAGALAVAGAVLPLPPLTDRGRALLGRTLLALGGLAVGWASAVVLADRYWQLRSWNAPYWAGLAAGAALVLGASLGRGRSATAPGWTRLVAVGLLLLGLLLVVGGCAGFREGYLVSGHEESEDGWYLGGLPLLTGLGVLAAGVAALRARWSLAAASLGSGFLLLMGLVIGIDEARRTLL